MIPGGSSVESVTRKDRGPDVGTDSKGQVREKPKEKASRQQKSKSMTPEWENLFV